MADIAVVGAGITGITTAYALVARGHTVTVYDRNRYPAMETSFANGGQLSASNAEVWNNWTTVGKGLRWLLRKDAPLLFNLRPSWHKYSWIAEFLAATRHYQANTQATVRLALMARERLFAIARNEGIDFDHERRGILHIYKSARAFAAAHETNAMLCAAGLQRSAVDDTAIHAIEPSLAGTYAGGFYTEGDSTGDIHKFTRGLAEVCRRKGVTLELGRTLDSAQAHADRVELVLDHAAGERRVHDLVVVCAGIESRRIAAWFRDRINVYPVKGYSITVPVPEDAPREVAPWVSLLDEEAKIVTSRLGQGRYRVAGTAEFNGANRDIRACRIRPLIDWVEAHHPQLDTSGAVPWAGLRPMMPDMMPRATGGKSDRVFYNTGHGHLGWTLSAATAEIVAERIGEAWGCDRDSVTDLAA